MAANGSQFIQVDPPLVVVPERYTCTICQKQCTSKTALISHQQIHSVDDHPEDQPASRRTLQRGAAKRHRLSFHQKADLVRQVNGLMATKKIAQKNAIAYVSADSGISTSTLYGFCRLGESIQNMAGAKKTKNKKSMYNRTWIPSLRRLEEQLAIDVRKRRRDGLGTCCRWVLARGRELRGMPNLVDPAHAAMIGLSRSWYYRGFLDRNGFSIRRGSNRRQKPIGELLPQAFKFHSSLFKEVNRRPFADPAWGHYSPSSVFNFDQVPLPFVCDAGKRTLDDTGAQRVWLRQPGSGLDKRQATLHMTLCAGGGRNQPRPIIVFRGAGKNIMKSSEVQEWDPRVNVLFQKCAWVDTPVGVQIAELYKKDPCIVQSESPRLFICDNLDAQISDDFTEAMKPIGSLFYLAPNMTGELQPIDAGPGRYIKHRMGVELDLALDEPRFREKWMGGKFTARERRVLITKWVGSAFETLCNVQGGIIRYFEKTGCLLHVNGEKNKINLQGMPEYGFDGGAMTDFVINLDESSDDDDDSTVFSEDNDSKFSEGDDAGASDDDEIDYDDIPIAFVRPTVKATVGTPVVNTPPDQSWEVIGHELHSFHVEGHSNPSKWIDGNQEAALAMLENFLRTSPGHFLATVHAERLRTPIKELIDLYEFKQRTQALQK